MTVKEVSELAHVSIRTLRYYDRIGLLTPGVRTASGYRQYGDDDLKKLQRILLFRELEIPLEAIKEIMADPESDPVKGIGRRIEMLYEKKAHVERLISLARNILENGGDYMDFSAFDIRKAEEYAKTAKEKWGGTDAYNEFEQRNGGRSLAEASVAGSALMGIMAEFGSIKNNAPDSEEALALVAKLKAHISGNYYTCTNEILTGLGDMYAAGGEFTENIDMVGGAGTAVFIDRAIKAYCKAERK